MVGVDHRGLEDVDTFDLLGLDPFDFSNFKPFDFLEPSLSRVQEVQQLKKAYRRLSLITHPDRKGDIAKFKQLSQLNEFLFQFNTSCPSIWRRIAELFRRGKDGWASTWNPRLKLDDPGFRKPTPAYIRYSSGRGRGRSHVRRPTPASALAKPGSSPSNPIVIDALEIGAPAPLAVDPLNRKRIKTKLCQRRRNRRSSYHPSRASKWRPAPYADQSDSDLGWD
ncbi:MAG: hypothetical protein M1839_003016 [Geoglossum umbratile]|nr:MAG: hypothetical protein M1839_003016 [Geoglossum umbratile]